MYKTMVFKTFYISQQRIAISRETVNKRVPQSLQLKE